MWKVRHASKMVFDEREGLAVRRVRQRSLVAFNRAQQNDGEEGYVTGVNPALLQTLLVGLADISASLKHHPVETQQLELLRKERDGLARRLEDTELKFKSSAACVSS